MYDPTIGRWLNEDPVGFAAGDANLYRYVENSPTNATDPSGLQVNPQVATPGNVHIVQRVLYPPPRWRPAFPRPGAPATTVTNTPGTWAQNFTFAPSRPTMASAHPFAQGTAPRPIPAAIIAALPNANLPTCGGGDHILYPATLAPGQFVGTSGCAGSIGLIIHSPGHGTAVFHFGTTNGAPQTINQYAWPAGSHAIIIGGINERPSTVQMNQVIGALAQQGIQLDGIVNAGNGYLGADGNWHIDTRPPRFDPR